MSDVQQINVQPSARILKVLGDIEFDPWQCIAELLDNSFDDFLDIEREQIPWPDGFSVGISLPMPSTPSAEAEVIVEDSGRGMSLATLNNAVRAGWSGNDQYSKLGLFGMGFNIATARLGRCTTVLTTQQGDDEWVGVKIDLDEIGDDFMVPVVREPKSSRSDHGTRVIVSRLESTREAWLKRNKKRLRETLGKAYSHLLDQRGYRVTVDGVMVGARRHCVWGTERYVTYGRGSTAEQIPAVIEIDKPLDPADICLACGSWQVPAGLDNCRECESTRLEYRERRIHGWLGIQRYLHKTDFGIDFLRNGRKILIADKLLFYWRDPEDPLATADQEYPVELGQGGRIVGEIHLDHVPVNYQKNAFEWSDRTWIGAVHNLRGEGPLLPRKARALKYSINDSPLGRLHRGYRRNDPGYRYLIPGDGNGPIHGSTLQWADKFHDGAPDYQSDDKWWEAVVRHETIIEQRRGGVGSTSDDVLEELGLSEDDSESTVSPVDGEGHAHAIEPGETEQDRLDRYRAHGTRIPELSREYGSPTFSVTMNVTAYLIESEEIRDSEGFRTPVLLVRNQGNLHDAFVDASHPVYQQFLDSHADYLVLEVAHQLRVRTEHAIPLAQAVAELKDRELGDMKLSLDTLRPQARELLMSVREIMADAIQENPDRAWQYLSSEERDSIETNLVVEGSRTALSEVEESGQFLLYAPALFLGRLVEEWPEAFLDGKVFVGRYHNISSVVSRRLSVARIASCLYDAALLSEATTLSPDHLARCRISLQLLRAELAAHSSEG